jgi:hypothetical protein
MVTVCIIRSAIMNLTNEQQFGIAAALDGG